MSFDHLPWDESIDQAARKLWDYHRLNHPLESADLILFSAAMIFESEIERPSFSARTWPPDFVLPVAMATGLVDILNDLRQK